MTGSEKQSRGGGEQPTLTWRLVLADPSVQEQMARTQARTIKEVLQWWTRDAARSRSTSSPEEPTAADPQD
ncbi:hypothetical protein GCM10022254_63770 [Actinomadura meridiana]|uniref:Uncharacterized protein n=1 Tax=Actinomadura meridiana TaxID=559626 RepID=A0ABP8CKB2_9ACTN